MERTEVSLSITVTTMIGGGVVKSGAGKSFEALGLNHGTTSAERGVTRISPSNIGPGGKISTRTLPKFKVQETPTVGIVSTKSHSWITTRVSPTPISLYVTGCL
jgi:hypothetical protein